MKNDNNSSAKIGGWNWPLVGALLFTLAYFVGAFFLFSTSEVCNGGFPGLLPGYFSCRSINEIGDFLAGLFAPVAFIWLAAAVMVQSRELSLQRKELELTRREFSETREVNRAQAEEARRQAEYIGVQTEIMKASQKVKKIEENDLHIDALIRNLHSNLTEMSQRVSVLMQKHGNSASYTLFSLPIDEKNFSDAVFKHIFQRYRSVATQLLAYVDEGSDPPSLSEEYYFRVCSESIDEIEKLSLEISDKKETDLKTAGVWEFINVFQHIESLLSLSYRHENSPSED